MPANKIMAPRRFEHSGESRGKKNETPENPKKRGGGARSGGERQLIRVDLAAGGDSHFHPEHVQHSSPPTVAGGEEWDGRERGGGGGEESDFHITHESDNWDTLSLRFTGCIGDGSRP